MNRVTKIAVAGFALVVVPLFAFPGCGIDEQTEARQWINEVILVNGGFQKTAAEGQKEIVAADTTEELEAAYSDYAAQLRKQLKEFERIDAPEVCADEQRVMERFMRETTDVTEKLANQRDLTPTAFRDLEERSTRAAKGLVNALKPALQGGSGC